MPIAWGRISYQPSFGLNPERPCLKPEYEPGTVNKTNALPLWKFQKDMRKLAFLGLLALVACQSNPKNEESTNGPAYPIYEQIETEVGGNVVYGVIVKDSSAERAARAYEVSFKLQDRVWIDTLFLELPGKEVIQGEMIFGEAVVNDMGGASFDARSVVIE